MKTRKKTDLLFAIVLLSGLFIYVYFVFSTPFFDDESFYAVVPYRLVNGDSLIQHEWHLTQFSALFSYLPIYLWTTIKGSADGIFVFLRFVYLFIHTSMAVLIYRFFRKYDNWAILASFLFYTQVPYKTLAISYQSMFVVFLILLSLCLTSIYRKKSILLYIFAGVCYGFCCVNNPIFCFAFAIYLIACALWVNRETITNKIIEKKIIKKAKKGEKITNKQKREKKQELIRNIPNFDKLDCFFSKESILRFLYGIVIAGVIAVAFFFLTGGSIDSIFDNIKNLLSSSEYDITSKSIFSKLIETIFCLNKASLYMAWIFPLLFISIKFDKNRKKYSHRITYITIAVVWSIIYAISTLVIYRDIYLDAVSLPFWLLSTVCYSLTEKKNKTLFYSIYVLGLIGTLFQYLAANTHLAVIGVVLVVCNIAGTFFVMDLWNEMHLERKYETKSKIDKKLAGCCCGVIVVGICIQLIIFWAYYSKNSIYTKEDYKVTVGPYAGVYMEQKDYEWYSNEINDMNIIKERTNKKDNVFLASCNNWMYMYLERPLATYTAWYGGSINQKQMVDFYKRNPKKVPKYIYIESIDPTKANVQVVNDMFEYTREDLSNGALLTIEDTKF